MGSSSDSIIQIKDELTKGKGDKVTFNLRMQLSGDGKTENQTLEGNEESFTIYSDSLEVNELRHAVRVPTGRNINDQRVAFDLKGECRDSLRDFFARRYSKVFFNQMGGYTPETNSVYTGNNSITAPSSGYIIRPAAAATDEAMTTDTAGTWKFDLRMIDYAKEKARTASPMIRPTMVDGKEVYVLYLDPRQVTDLRTSTTTGQWQDITMAIQMGWGDKSDIVKGSLGMYNGVILREAPDNLIAQGVHSSSGAAVTDVRRAVFLGAQAAVCAWSKGGGPSTYDWVEEDFDYRHQAGVSAGTIYGMKKTRFNSTDYGVVVISTSAISHTTTP
jgi:N4-gp56 family major capsid protein